MLLCAVKQKPSSWVFIQKSKLAVDIEKEPQVFPTLKKQACFCSASGEAFSPFSMVGSGFLGKMFLSVPTTWLRNRMEDRMKNGWKEAKCWMLTWKLKKLWHQFSRIKICRFIWWIHFLERGLLAKSALKYIFIIILSRGLWSRILNRESHQHDRIFFVYHATLVQWCVSNFLLPGHKIAEIIIF